MLLQMSWEKLAKAALVMSGAWDPQKRTHKVAAKFASVLKKAPRIEQIFGTSSRATLAARLTWLQGELEALEALTPTLSTGETQSTPGRVAMALVGRQSCGRRRISHVDSAHREVAAEFTCGRTFERSSSTSIGSSKLACLTPSSEIAEHPKNRRPLPIAAQARQ
jgi:hypothetical protein